MTWDLVFKFLFLMVIICGGVLFALHHFFISSVEGAKQRLEKDAESARAREAELALKIRQADEELKARKAELDMLETRLKNQIEAEANQKKEELVTKARADAEEIIIKAQNSADALRKDIEKQMEMKILDYATNVLEAVLGNKTKETLEKDLMEEFIEQLKTVDMSKISLEIKQATILTAGPISESNIKRIADIIKNKIQREITFSSKIEKEYIAGVVIQFGSLMLDGSLHQAIKDAAMALKIDIEKGRVTKS